MKSIRLVVLAFLATLAFLSCASVPTEENYQKIPDSWLGSNINSLVDSWGYPTGELKAPNGNKVYYYENSDTVRRPSVTTYNSLLRGYVTTGGGDAAYWCRTFFEVDDSGKILRWRHEGNSCVSRRS